MWEPSCNTEPLSCGVCINFRQLVSELNWIAGLPVGVGELKKVLLTPEHSAAVAAAKSLQSCPTLCDPIVSSPSGSPVPGILQARTLEWVAISFSNAWKWKVKVKSLSRVRLFMTPWTAAYQAPPSMGFARQEYWSRVPLPFLPKHSRALKSQDLGLTISKSIYLASSFKFPSIIFCYIKVSLKGIAQSLQEGCEKWWRCPTGM